MADTGSEWKLSAATALTGYFRQPDGTSKAGSDWAVSLTDGVNQYMVQVRVFSEDVEGMTVEQQSQVAVNYVIHRLKRGWKPTSYSGRPGELTVPSRPPK